MNWGTFWIDIKRISPFERISRERESMKRSNIAWNCLQWNIIAVRMCLLEIFYVQHARRWFSHIKLNEFNTLVVTFYQSGFWRFQYEPMKWITNSEFDKQKKTRKRFSFVWKMFQILWNSTFYRCICLWNDWKATRYSPKI